MMVFVKSMVDVILDRSPDELIGAVMVALVLAGAMTGLYALAWRKVSDVYMLIVGLTLFANVTCMALAAGYVVYVRRAVTMPAESSPPFARRDPHRGGFHPGVFGPGNFLAPQIIAAADADKDGQLSAEEAGKAAEQLVREADADKNEAIDAETLSRAINRQIGAPPGAGAGGPPGDFGPRNLLSRLLAAADTDKDGRLSSEEAALFVRKTDTTGKGSIDAQEIDDALRDHIKLQSGSESPNDRAHPSIR